MTRPGDPKGYYARLGVAPWANQQAIDSAFRARSLELQPERNPAPGAPERLQAVVEAHRVLSDEARRRAYDDGNETPPTGTPAALPWFRHQPVLIGIGASVAVLIVVAAVVHDPHGVAPSPARALTPPPMPIPPRLERRVVSASGVNLRAGPGRQHAQTSRIPRGETVDVLQPETEGWVRVRLNDGRTGYIAARFLTAP